MFRPSIRDAYWLIVVLGLAAILWPSHRNAPHIHLPQQTAKEAWKEIMDVVQSADRVEYEIIEEGYVRTGPVIITDKSVIASLAAELQQAEKAEENPYPYADVISGISVRVTFIRRRGVHCARLRTVGTQAVHFPESERFRVLLASDKFFSQLADVGEEYAKAHPEDRFH